MINDPRLHHASHMRALKKDIALVFLSVVVAILFVETDAIRSLMTATENVQILSIFIAGLFFTSVFTTPVSIAFLGELALVSPVWLVALVGACGAVVGDLAIFGFVKNTLMEDVKGMLSLGKQHRRLRHIVKMRVFRWLTPVLGAVVIASPLPDELGLALMGISKMKLKVFIPVSFIMNFIGILIIALIAQSL